jgi:hypothetical protein
MLLVSIETPEEDQAISDTWGLGNVYNPQQQHQHVSTVSNVITFGKSNFSIQNRQRFLDELRQEFRSVGLGCDR